MHFFWTVQQKHYCKVFICPVGWRTRLSWTEERPLSSMSAMRRKWKVSSAINTWLNFPSALATKVASLTHCVNSNLALHLREAVLHYCEDSQKLKHVNQALCAWVCVRSRRCVRFPCMETKLPLWLVKGSLTDHQGVNDIILKSLKRKTWLNGKFSLVFCPSLSL